MLGGAGIFFTFVHCCGRGCMARVCTSTRNTAVRFKSKNHSRMMHFFFWFATGCIACVRSVSMNADGAGMDVIGK